MVLKSRLEDVKKVDFMPKKAKEHPQILLSI